MSDTQRDRPGVLDDGTDVDLGDPVNRDHDLNRGRLAWWLTLPGLEGGVTFSDLTGLNDGSLSSTAGWGGTSRPGGFGQLQLDGSTSAVAVAAAAGTSLDVQGTAITFGGWVFPLRSGVYQTILGKILSGTSRQYAVYLSGASTSQVYVALAGTSVLGGGGANVTISTPWAVGAWNRVLVAYDGSTVTVYLNGSAVSSAGESGSIVNVATYLALGYSANDHFPLQGYLDDCTVYGRALSAADARADYDLSARGYPGVLNRH